jgi:hypothetical protein
VLVVAHRDVGDDRIRIISARRATRGSGAIFASVPGRHLPLGLPELILMRLS